ncbi:MAG: hydantoinase/oxoprolinase family protein [Gammaproteobacteria bacterium]|nr:hydantoinase/oxoprolinase family protein [Gammaproteobacteria bacterium]
MHQATNNRLAVDIGGTFTDVVIERGLQRYTTKVLTTQGDPADGVLAGIEEVLAVAEAEPAETSLVLHGTTLATNAIIERSGAVTALLTTQGHRDALEMAFENRFEQYDINIDRPTPLVPRHLRIGIAERMDARGDVLLALNEDSVAACIPTLRDQQVESVVVGLLHAYVNAAHERRIGEMLEAALPAVSITLASDVCPEIREYERLSTACANAYVKPLMDGYLSSLETKLRARGFVCPVLLMTSGGGLTTLATARRYPIRLVESGPAGGAILAARIAAEGGYDEVLSFDMGGTTAKICVIDDAEPMLSRAFEVDRVYRFKKGSGLPVRIPVIEMVEIGAGGGSIARVDKLSRIQVGPESAGSEPGPACYGLGGKNATVTDADVVLGKIEPESFASGRMKLDVEAARVAVVSALVSDDSAGNEAELAAHGISEVVDENMAAAARAHATEWGRDVAGRTVVAFGGAAPLHAAQLANKLKLDRVIIPVNAGVGSAIGFLIAPISYEVVRSRYMRLSNFDSFTANEVMTEMRAEALEVVNAAAPDAELTEFRRAYMRYLGQGYEIAVPVPVARLSDQHAVELRQAFDSAYESLYGRTIPNLDVEILSWTLSLSAPNTHNLSPLIDWEGDAEMVASTSVETPEKKSAVFDPVEQQMLETAHYRRDALPPGKKVRGPALIMEGQTTTAVTVGFEAHVDARGHLILERLRSSDE